MPAKIEPRGHELEMLVKPLEAANEPNRRNIIATVITMAKALAAWGPDCVAAFERILLNIPDRARSVRALARRPVSLPDNRAAGNAPAPGPSGRDEAAPAEGRGRFSPVQTAEGGRRGFLLCRGSQTEPAGPSRTSPPFFRAVRRTHPKRRKRRHLPKVAPAELVILDSMTGGVTAAAVDGRRTAWNLQDASAADQESLRHPGDAGIAQKVCKRAGARRLPGCHEGRIQDRG